MTVLAVDSWPTNAHLIEDVAKLGYLKPSDRILDVTYGHGTFWKRWQPDPSQGGELVGCDLDPAKSPVGYSVDFTKLPRTWDDRFDVVVFDAPYKLNGTPDEATDERYGVHERRSWQERMELILKGAVSVQWAVRPGGKLLVKVQPQVCSGAVRWQDIEVINALAPWATLVDRFDMLGGRPQPGGRRQVHAHRRPSTLLVLEVRKP